MSEASNQTSAILVLGDARRHALISSLHATLNVWGSRWGFAHMVEQARLTALHYNQQSDGEMQKEVALCLSCSTISNKNLVADIRLQVGVVDALLQLPKDTSLFNGAFQNGPVIGDVLQMLARSLSDIFTSAISSVNWRIDATDGVSVKTNREHHERDWFVAVNLSNASTPEIVFRLSSELVAKLLPSFAAAGGIARRASAITSEKIKLQAILGEASVSIGDLTSLSVDDVLVLEADPSTTGYLVNAKGIRVSNFALGRSGAKRAVQITSIANKR